LLVLGVDQLSAIFRGAQRTGLVRTHQPLYPAIFHSGDHAILRLI
jgi:hypothetical protein